MDLIVDTSNLSYRIPCEDFCATASQGMETEKVHGRKRGQLLREANTSSKVGFVADKLGKRGGVQSVFKYTLDDGSSGFGVTYGAGDQSKGATIQYYTSEEFENGPAVRGGKPSGDGIMSVVADGKVIIDSADTPRASEALEAIRDNDDYKQFKQGLTATSLNEDHAVLAHTESGTKEPTNIIIPVMNNGKAIDRLVLSGPGWPSSANIQNYSANSPTSDSPVLDQDAPCGAICAAVSVGSFGLCTAACAYSGVAAEFAVTGECGELCSAVAEGACIPFCKNHS